MQELQNKKVSCFVHNVSQMNINIYCLKCFKAFFQHLFKLNTQRTPQLRAADFKRPALFFCVEAMFL